VSCLKEVLDGVPVLVGGGAVPRTDAVALGADGWGRDGAALVDLLEELPSAS
jgi:hypothetical protein